MTLVWLVEAMGLEPTNLLTASQALYQLSYAPEWMNLQIRADPGARHRPRTPCATIFIPGPFPLASGYPTPLAPGAPGGLSPGAAEDDRCHVLERPLGLSTGVVPPVLPVLGRPTGFDHREADSGEAGSGGPLRGARLNAPV